MAKVVKLGYDHMGPPASTSDGPTKFKVARSLKGMAKEGLSPTFHVMTVPAERAERVPLSGDECVSFIETRDGVTPHILKMMAASMEDIDVVQDALQRLYGGRNP